MVSLTSDLGRPLLVDLPPPFDNVGAIGGLAPGDFALEARDDCSFPFPLERPRDLDDGAPARVGLGLIPPKTLIEYCVHYAINLLQIKLFMPFGHFDRSSTYLH